MTPFQHALEPAGPQAAHIAQLWWLTIAICGAVFVAILVAFCWALWRAPRASEHTAADVSALRSTEPRTQRAVVVAVGISTVLLFVLVVASVATDRALARLPLQDAVNIDVVAHQWWWEVRYEHADPMKVFATANEIEIPVGRPVLLTLKSDDVIHSFWVPNLHGKKDLIPGRTATLHLQAEKPGVYRGQCAEFCGLQHAFMAFYVKAVPPVEFESWLERQRQPAAEPADERQKRGRELFLSGTCMMCHAIQGTPANGRKAPDLTHVASRETLAAGRLPNTPEHLAAWIADPHKFKAGVNMPAHHVARADLDALVAYLGSLQ
jgi:cytochrome c oxidase subunit 2